VSTRQCREGTIEQRRRGVWIGVLDFVGVPAVDAVAEVSLSALEAVVGALPVRTLALVAGARSECVMGVGDGVVEAVGLDARGGLLPDAASARLVRESAQRFREVRSWSLEDNA
jgi:hypothetical protein